MSFEIRDARPGDEATILGLIKELAAYEKLEHEVVGSEADLTLTLFSENPKIYALIAEDADGPFGYALYFFNYSTFLCRHGLYLEDLYVRKDRRGNGAGKALLAKLAAIAKAQNCGRMEWWVLDWNTPSIEFYKSLGAEPMDEWTVYRLTGDALSRLADEGEARP